MKQFEVDYYKSVYYGEYYFEERVKLVIDNVHYFSEGGEEVEIDSINDKEIFDAVYNLVYMQHSDEIISEEEYKSDLRYSIAEEKWKGRD